MRRLSSLAFLILACTLRFAAASPQKAISSPEEAFGFKPGTDRKLADWKEIVSYLQKLASESDRVRYQELGKTEEGRPFIALTISAPENLAHLADYREIQRRLADPRQTSPEEAKALAARGKAVLLVTCNIHSTEIASSQSATEFAYRLATENSPEIQSILHNVILLLIPSLNPDGQQLVVDWYKKYLGTPYEGTQPVVLWNRYVGHDDNRDWVGFTQAETKHATDLINAWHPQMLYDLHQMGADGPRIYLPPWVDPIDPNVDPLLISSMNAVGVNAALDLASSGKSGILVHGVYDFWSPLRDYISYHNGLRVLTESASVNIASPIDIPFNRLGRGIGYDAKVASWNFPNPWKGGTWHLGDIVDYQTTAFFSIANYTAVNRERFLTNFYAVSSRAVHPSSGPYAYVIPAAQADPAATARLIQILRQAAVEVERATAPFEAGGSSYPAGSYIVRLDQPNRNFAKTVLEIQHYPDLREYPGGPLQRPYDVTAQTLPLLMGVQAAAIEARFTAPCEEVKAAPVPAGTFHPVPSSSGYLVADTTNSSLYALFFLLGKGIQAYRLTGEGYAPGTIYIPPQADALKALSDAAKRFPIDVRPAAHAISGKALSLTLPRVGLYQSWVPSMDEGWTRWIFDQNSIPYTRLVDAEIRKGDLRSRYDVIILPDNTAKALLTGRGGFGQEGMPPIPPEYTGGLGDDGAANLKAFAEAGGTIITLNKASEVYATKTSADVSNVLDGLSNKEFYIPGSILQVSVDTSSPIGFGSTPTVPVFFELSPSFKVSGDARSIASYTSDDPLLSGWILGGKYLNGAAAIAEEPVGRGRIVMFGFRPQYRGMSEVTYKFLFNAMLYSTSVEKSLGATAAASLSNR
ncbi:MAG TPA: M14 metallopeptidase family protein [Acidobacteriaceae bacterium]|nr:M14 metallopeptidase family protein [Acidobacteriaceae bacterium]